MLGQQETNNTQQRKTYLNVKEGGIVKHTATGEERYSFVEGVVERIFQKERSFRNEIVLYWYIDLRDKESGELYSVGFSYSSNVFKSIILQLASEKGLQAVLNRSVVRIEPYFANGYDKVALYGGGVKLDWRTKDLPPVEEALVGGRRIKDDTKRMELISSLVDMVKEALHKGNEKKVN